MAFGEVEEGPFTGLLRITDPPEQRSTVRVFKRFGEYRVEDLDGELLEIRRHLSTYNQATGLDQPAWSAFDVAHGRFDYAHAIERREPAIGRATTSLSLGRRVPPAPPPCWGDRAGRSSSPLLKTIRHLSF
ncbi:hypothetical protein [Aeromicrobium sp. UC242_57]|uniref:hypothetical protein n=1 Tax=Aeromicrobium sp. UC242_57 TaxID=3374624 RepID=UPI00379D279A